MGKIEVPYFLTLSWWRYIFAPTDIRDYPLRYKPRALFRVWQCRWQGHPYGVVFFNPNGSEPYMTCLNCGDDLG